MRHLLRPVLFVALGMAIVPVARLLAAEADIYWQGGTSTTGAPIFIAATSTNPLPVACQ